MASVLLRLVVADPLVWLDVGRTRRVGVADASLRPLGLRPQRLVLDPRTHLGSGLGVVVVLERLRELVPARLRQPSGLRGRIASGVGPLERTAEQLRRARIVGRALRGASR